MTAFEKVLDFWFKESGKRKWCESIQGRLAEIIVLDQFSRNVFRNHSEAFAYDNPSLVLAQEALKDEALNNLTSEENYTRSRASQNESKFGRYPHRNKILNRESTEEESHKGF